MGIQRIDTPYGKHRRSDRKFNPKPGFEDYTFNRLKWGHMTHVYGKKLDIFDSDKNLSPTFAVPSQYQYQCRYFVTCTLRNKIKLKLCQKYNYFHCTEYNWKYRLQNGGHVVSASVC